MADGSTESYSRRHATGSIRQAHSFARMAYPRQRAIRACQLCRARRIKCDNMKPACSSCARIGAECIKADIEGASLDSGSLQILHRIDDLEELIKKLVTRETETVEEQLKTQRKQNYQICATTEEVLSWTVFQGHYDNHRDLKALLRAGPSTDLIASPMSTDSPMFAGHVEHASPQRMLDNFIRSIHVKNPILDETKIKQVVHQMSLDGPRWTTDHCLALIVCALGSITTSFDTDFGASDPQMLAVGESYFIAAQRRLGLIVGSGGISEAQCFFYSGVYLMSKLQPLRAWRLFCQALACCQDFACADPSYQDHLVPSDSGRLPAEECVYWSCWKSERELRKLLNLPDFAFDELLYPLLFPTPPESNHELQTTSWYFYLSEISLRRLEHRVRAELGNALGGSKSGYIGELEKTTRAVEALAEEWTQSLPAVMSLQTEQEEDDVLKFILRGHLLDLWEVVYWPWLDALFNKRLNISEVTRYIVKALQVAVDRIRINKPGFHHRHHGTWLMLQSCTRSALILLATAYVPEAAVLLPDGWRDAVFETIELLRFWKDGAGDTANRLQILVDLSADVE